MKRSHGAYSKRSRHFRSKGKTAISKHLTDFKPGAKVRILVSPSFKGKPSTLRFNHKSATVVCKQGKSFVVEFKDGGKAKRLVLSNVHLEALK